MDILVNGIYVNFRSYCNLSNSLKQSYLYFLLNNANAVTFNDTVKNETCFLVFWRNRYLMHIFLEVSFMTKKHSLIQNDFYADMAESADRQRVDLFRSCFLFDGRTNITRSNEII